jgi:hypothetical protein
VDPSVVDAIATRAPPRPIARAAANPIPVGLPAPVTSATRFSKLIVAAYGTSREPC